jgi:replicative DNA helicase
MSYDEDFGDDGSAPSSAELMMDPAAESAVIAAALDQPRLIKTVAGLPTEVFATGVNRRIHEALVDLHKAGEPCDHTSVIRRAGRMATTKNQQQDLAARVTGYMGRGMNVTIGFHVERLLSLEKSRRVSQSATRLIQRVQESVKLDDGGLLAEGISETLIDLEAAQADAGIGVVDEAPMSLGELLDRQEAEHDWLIPGVMERMERLILTGFEGTGKSYLLAQMALTVAAGLNPFAGFPSGEPRRVLVVDCENSERQTRRRYRKIRGMVEQMCERHNHPVPDWYKAVRFVIRPEGVELNDPREVKRIERAIVATEPDLVIIGPLYRLHRLDTRDEQAAKELVSILDLLRVRHRFAMLAEAHVNHASGGQARALRPTGSAVFLRWPEFGLGLRPAAGTDEDEHPSKVDMVAWRGGRDDRVWPSQLHHSYGRLPWTADDKYEMRLSQAGYAG